MDYYDNKEHNFLHPTTLFILEDMLKGLIGGPLLYHPYFSTFGIKGDEKILDFGCGGGVGSVCLATMLNKGGHLTCIDLSPYWIKKARKRLRKFTYAECKVGDICSMDIADFSFDVITVFRVIHDISPTKRRYITPILVKKLKSGGKLFIRERIGKSHGIPVSELRDLLVAVGLKEIQHKETKSEYIGIYQKTN
jgi:ubiquinone/menaquinone biosynthesis C-methylase UbiE